MINKSYCFWRTEDECGVWLYNLSVLILLHPPVCKTLA